MNAKAVIFDLDGTLLDTLRDLADSMNAVLADWSVPTHSTDAYLQMIGGGVANLVTRALPRDQRGEQSVANALRRVRQEYAWRWKLHTAPYPGVPDLLDRLAGRGVPMAILSNKPHEATAAIVEALLSRWAFVEVRGHQDPVPLKPGPRAALQILARMSRDAGSVLFVGDTPSDMETARAGGMRPVGVAWGFRTAESLREAGAEVVLDRPEQLETLLDGSLGQPSTHR